MITKLALALSVAATLGATAPVLADDDSAVVTPEEVGSNTGLANPYEGLAINQPPIGYMAGPGGRFIPLQNLDVTPEKTVPAGETPPSPYEADSSGN